MTGKASLKVAGFALSLAVPLLTPLGVDAGAAWLAPAVVFGVLPVLGLLIGEDRALPDTELYRSQMVRCYLRNLPRAYAVVWIGVLVWTLSFVAQTELGALESLWIVVSMGIGSAVAVCTAHELMHRRSVADGFLARLMMVLCGYGHMVVEHRHHHATVGDAEVGGTAPPGFTVYRFATRDYVQGLRNSWNAERTKLRRGRASVWRNIVLQDYTLVIVFGAAVGFAFGAHGIIVFLGQGVFAIFVFEVITYVHHYGLVVTENETPGPQHAWAHHCWITNCLTFNNTYHSDHHARPEAPYYSLHAMHGVPRLPASYFTMFCVALVPPLWFRLMDSRLDAITRSRDPMDDRAVDPLHYCR